MKLNKSISLAKYLPYLKHRAHRFGYMVILTYFLYILFFLYQNLFIPFFDKNSIDPALIQRKKEVVNQTLFEQVLDSSTEKVGKPTRINRPTSDPFQ
ncbi:MAG: hypothetical protein WCT33_00485 [Patescibacteria group bacterium]